MITYKWDCSKVEAYPSINEVPAPMKYKEGDELPIHLKNKKFDELPFFLKYKEGDEEKLFNIIYRINVAITGFSDKVDQYEIPIVETIETICNLKSVNADAFKNVDELSGEEVTSWVKSILGENRVIELEKILQNKINEKSKPKSITLNITN